MSESEVADEIAKSRKLASTLLDKTLRVKADATKNEKEIRRIALQADSKLGTKVSAESERHFGKEPWTDKVSAG